MFGVGAQAPGGDVIEIAPVTGTGVGSGLPDFSTDEWESLRDSAPVFVREVSWVDPRNQIVVRGGGDVRRVYYQGQFVTEVTVRVKLNPAERVSEQDVAATWKAFAEGAEKVVNKPGHWLLAGPVGDLLRVKVEPDDGSDPELAPHLTVSLVPADSPLSMDQRTWKVGKSGLLYVHEGLGHQLGLRDEYADPGLDADPWVGRPGSLDVLGSLMGDLNRLPEDEELAAGGLRPRHLQIIGEWIGDMDIHMEGDAAAATATATVSGGAGVAGGAGLGAMLTRLLRPVENHEGAYELPEGWVLEHTGVGWSAHHGDVSLVGVDERLLSGGGSGQSRLIFGVPGVEGVAGDVPARVWARLRQLLDPLGPGAGVELVVHGTLVGNPVPLGWSLAQQRTTPNVDPAMVDVRVIDVDVDPGWDGQSDEVLKPGRARFVPSASGVGMVGVKAPVRHPDPVLAEWQLAKLYRAVVKAAEVPAAAAAAARVLPVAARWWCRCSVWTRVGRRRNRSASGRRS